MSTRLHEAGASNGQTLVRWNPSYRRDRALADRYVEAIRQVIGMHLYGGRLLVEAPAEEDIHRNTDLTLTADRVRIACRVRNPDVWHKDMRYREQFTLRAHRDSGAKTELAKVLEGWGDYNFYGHAHPVEMRFVAWTIGDLSVFRGWFHRELLKTGKEPGALIPNTEYLPDGRVVRDSWFRAFDLSALPSSFVVDKYRPDDRRYWVATGAWFTRAAG